MLVDTHCHIHNMVKKDFDVALTDNQIKEARHIIEEADASGVLMIMNVGTSVVESENAVRLSQHYESLYAVVGIHPTDTRHASIGDMKKIASLLKNPKSEKIVGLGECGFDFYHQGYSKQKQKDFFLSHIELALEYDRALIVHSRDAYDETLLVLEQYKSEKLRGVIHCFSYDQQFVDIVTAWGFYLGIGGTITYPKNQSLRDIVQKIDLSHIVLETDAPFLPIQSMRGKTNHPRYIKDIAEYIAKLKQCSFEEVAEKTTKNAKKLCNVSI
jgi:TatD DNase family protein